MPPTQAHRGVKLPRALLDEIGQDRQQNDSRGHRQTTGQSRKERRKTSRTAKKQSHQVNHNEHARALTKPRHHNGNLKQNTERAQATQKESSAKARKVPQLQASDSKPVETDSASDSESSESQSEQVSKPRVSRAKRDRLAQDDADIAALEKKLGVKGRLPKSFADDGLDDLLGSNEISEEENTGEKKRLRDEEIEWLANKRRKAVRNTEPDVSIESDDSQSLLEDDSEGASEDDLDGVASSNDDSEGGSFDGFDSSEDEPLRPARENPYKPPVESQHKVPVGKYVPPSQRTSNGQEDAQIRRKIQGLLNRLSEANLLSILAELEKAYRDHPRQLISTALLDSLMNSVNDSAALQDTFIVLHAGFLAAVYKVVGTGFGGETIQRVVDQIEKRTVNNEITDEEKSVSNLVSLLSELYNFQVVGSTLIYDFIRQFVSTVTETHTELLLRILKHSGPQLRQDDPSSLKDIVIELHASTQKVGAQSLSVRSKFMMETINNLKNNRVKTGVASSKLLSEHITKMRKALGSLNSRSLKASQPLQVGLSDLREVQKRGKWWLVGSSYKGTELQATRKPEDTKPDDYPEEMSDASVDLPRLAREQGMNTVVRRSIFLAITSATDYKDAHLRLVKLQLSRPQKPEIPKVLIHCATKEDSYNPYYTLIAGLLCEDRKFRMAFQFALWDTFKSMGESVDDMGGVEEDNEFSMRSLVNLSKIYASLVVADRLNLYILSNLNFSCLGNQTRVFVELLLINIILDIRAKYSVERGKVTLESLVRKTQSTPGLVSGLRYFVRKVLRKTDIAGTERNKRRVIWGCGLIEETLKAVTMDESSAQ